jgi:probable HAF family extracellular repeat protein
MFWHPLSLPFPGDRCFRGTLWFVGCVLLALTLAGIAPAQAQPYSYATHALQLIDLGAGVNPVAINDVGQVVGQGATSEAFFWENGTLTPLGTLGGSESFANDLNDSGIVVGWSLDQNEKKKAFRWTSANGLQNIGASSALESVAEAINSEGTIVGWRTNGPVTKSAMWGADSDEAVTLFTIDPRSHRAVAINDHGVIVGVGLASDDDPIAGFFWDGQGSGAEYSGGFSSSYLPMAGINILNVTAGQIGDTAIYYPISQQPHIMPPVMELDVISESLGLNDTGQIVGESDDKGFLYDIGTNVTFDLNAFPRLTPGFGQILRLNDINNDGTFVGVALVDGVEHGFVGNLVSVPEPSGLALLAIGLAACAIVRRRPSR